MGTSRGFTLRNGQTTGELGFAMEFITETVWHFAQLLDPRDG